MNPGYRPVTDDLAKRFVKEADGRTLQESAAIHTGPLGTSVLVIGPNNRLKDVIQLVVRHFKGGGGLCQRRSIH